MSFAAIFSLIVVIAVVALIFWVCWWGLGALGLPEPFNKIAIVILVIAVLGFVLLYLAPKLLALGGVS